MPSSWLFVNMAARTSRVKKWFVLLLLLAAIAAAVAVAFWYVREEQIEEARFVRYPAFGIDIPVNYRIHGIDVSKYQSYIYWPAVKAMRVDSVRLGFVFIKATEGTDRTDPQFKRNWKLAERAGMVKGAYHFFYPSRNGVKQAQQFVKQVALRPGDLPPVVDIEQLYGVPPARARAELKACLQALEAYYKVKPVIYSYANFYMQYLGKEFEDYPLWIAHYLAKERPRINRSWNFWQHNETGRVNGITHKVDFNVFNGDSAAFRSLLLP